MRTWPFSTTASQVGLPPQPVSDESSGTYSKDLNRILTAAVVNRRFCHLLLTDPQAALHNGYNGESFHLSEREQQALLAVDAANLRDFAAQLIERMLQEDTLAGHATPARRNEAAPGVVHLA
jgi:hypothetical protein